MTKAELFQEIKKKESYLCVGLDTDIKKIPDCLKKEADPVFAFNKAIIEATADFAVAYKPNIAFYEAQGPRGWESLQKTMEVIPENCFTIADAKRGDIGNTSSLYARTFFDKNAAGFDFDSVTVAPYMGRDSVMPFLEFENKWVILLVLTSNIGSEDFQVLETDGEKIYEKVLKTAQSWASSEALMFVVGATKAEDFAKIRLISPDNFLLVPGIGAQGGDLGEVSRHGMNKECGLLVNSSRAIIFASSGTDFAAKARLEAQNVQQEMSFYLEKYLP